MSEEKVKLMNKTRNTNVNPEVQTKKTKQKL